MPSDSIKDDDGELRDDNEGDSRDGKEGECRDDNEDEDQSQARDKEDEDGVEVKNAEYDKGGKKDEVNDVATNNDYHEGKGDNHDKIKKTKDCHEDDDKEDYGDTPSNIFQGDGADSIGDLSTTLSWGSMLEPVDVEDHEYDDEDDHEDGDEDDHEDGDEDDHEDGDEHDHEDDDEEEDQEDDDEGDHECLTNSEQPPAWFEPYERAQEERPTVLRRINVNNRVAKSSELPTIAATNTRSILPKFRNFVQDLKERQISVCFISETWQKESSRGNKRFQNEVERMFQLSGLKFISCPRPSSKRGGGAAIIVDTANYSCEKLDILVPGNLECVWAILRPKIVTKETLFKEILLAGFYSPPRSRKNAKLLDHLISTFHSLLMKYPNCGWAAGGDKNQFPLAPLLGALPKCRQLVTKNTHKNSKIYDVILTNMGQFYSVPYIAPACQPDDSASGAVPSDHDMGGV